MRILHVIESLDPRNGGPPEIAASLAAAQAAINGQQVSIVHQSNDDDAAIHKLIDGIPGFDRVRRTAVAPPGGGRFRAVLARGADADLERLVREHDIVHLHNVWDGLLVRAARACRNAGVPYVVLVNGMLDTWSLAQRPWRKRVAMATTHRALLRGAAAFHCGNEYERGVVERLRFGPRTFVLANGIWLSRIDEAASAGFRSARPELQRDPFVLFLSRLHRKKGLDFLLPAFEQVAAKHASLRLVIAGPDGGDLALVNETKARSLVGDRIHAVGPLYGRDKFAALAETACFCLPSRQEGFPMAVLEALGSRAPVVLSPACHMDEVERAGAGLVAPLDAPAISHAIDQIIATPDARRTLGNAGRALVESKYTWEQIGRESIASYERLRVVR